METMQRRIEQDYGRLAGAPRSCAANSATMRRCGTRPPGDRPSKSDPETADYPNRVLPIAAKCDI
jgi:hypothetical protein